MKADLIASFSMLQRDSLHITFIHRLFQEYFAAYFLSRAALDNFYGIVRGLAAQGSAEHGVLLLADISPARFESEWLSIFFTSEIAPLLESVKSASTADFVRVLYGGITIVDGRGVVPGPAISLGRQIYLLAKMWAPRIKSAALHPGTE